VFFSFLRWCETESTCYVGHQLAYSTSPGCGAVGGMRIGRGKRNTRRKPAPMPLCPPQIPHYLTWARTRPAAAGSRLLTAWAMGRRYKRKTLIIVLTPNVCNRQDWLETVATVHVPIDSVSFCTELAKLKYKEEHDECKFSKNTEEKHVPLF
jgi:hypothetical protein